MHSLNDRTGEFARRVESILDDFAKDIPWETAREFLPLALGMRSISDEEANAEVKHAKLLSLLERADKLWSAILGNIINQIRESDYEKQRRDEIEDLRQRMASQTADLERAQRDLNDFLVSSKNEIAALIGKIAHDSQTFNDTIERYLEKEKELNEILGQSSKLGLAGAFGNRAKKLALGKYFWIALFAASLLCVYINGQGLLVALREKVEWPQFVIRAALSFPLIWAACLVPNNLLTLLACKKITSSKSLPQCLMKGTKRKPLNSGMR